jgi:hypothetical protein
MAAARSCRIHTWTVPPDPIAPRQRLLGRSARTAVTAVVGTISSAGFAGGNRIVVGHWPTSPIGPFGDVMWVTADDQRILLAPSGEVADFVTSIYTFDDVRVVELDVHSDGHRTTARCDALDLELVGGRLRPVPFPRPRAVTRYVEAPIARALMAVETYGTSATGAREWYQTRGWRWVVAGRASVGGRDVGPPTAIDRPIGVGFSEPPRRPSIVSVRVAIDLSGVGAARPAS